MCTFDEWVEVGWWRAAIAIFVFQSWAILEKGLFLFSLRVHTAATVAGAYRTRNGKNVVRVWYIYSVEAICLISHEPRSWLAG
jgi:hypothetical protein